MLVIVFQSSSSLPKKMAVLNCQLKKAEVSRKTYEVATDHLLQFAEVPQFGFCYSLQLLIIAEFINKFTSISLHIV